MIIWKAEIYSHLGAVFTNEAPQILFDFLVQAVPVFNILAFCETHIVAYTY